MRSPILLLVLWMAACATPLQRGRVTKSPAHEELPKFETTLSAFAQMADRQRLQTQEGAPMPEAEVANWERMLGSLEDLSGWEMHESEALLAQVFEREVHHFGEIPERLSEAIVERLGQLASATGSMYLEWPVQPVGFTSLFGVRLDPISKVRHRHTGVDLQARSGQRVMAAAPGTVVKAEWSRGYGFRVEVRHDPELLTGYSHLSQILVTVGQEVSRGEVLGLAGSTGRSTGVHLHFELWKDGKPCNPLQALGPPQAARITMSP